MISSPEHFAELVGRGVCQLEYPLKGGKPAMPKKDYWGRRFELARLHPNYRFGTTFALGVWFFGLQSSLFWPWSYFPDRGPRVWLHPADPGILYFGSNAP
jgi:hypothetical protein